MVSRKSSSLSTTSTTTTSSWKSSASPGSAVTELDADEKHAMPKDEYLPLTAAVPQMGGVSGPYCPRRPNLKEILANTAPAPWTLAAFMAYLSNNLCLETLEFTMDAGRYKKHYAKMMSRASSDQGPPLKDREYVQALWQRLVDAYIQPNGSREVNLPSDVRDPIIRVKPAPGALPPAPEMLDVAVTKVYELMEESVLVPFLNSAYPQGARPTYSAYHASDENLPKTAQRQEERSGSRPQRSSSPHHTGEEPHHSYSYGPPSVMNSYGTPSQKVTLNRQSAPPATLTTAMNKSRFSAKLTPTTSAPAVSSSMDEMDEHLVGFSDPNASSSGSGPGMTDDSGDTSSPTNEGPETPPHSAHSGGEGHSPKRDSGMWKKLGRLSGMKKKKSNNALKEGH